MRNYHFYENTKESIKAVKLVPSNDYTMRVHFSNGEVKNFDFKPYLNTPAFSPLKNIDLFYSVKIKCGTAYWNYDRKCKYLADDIDISKTALYWDGIPV